MFTWSSSNCPGPVIEEMMDLIWWCLPEDNALTVSEHNWFYYFVCLSQLSEAFHMFCVGLSNWFRAASQARSHLLKMTRQGKSPIIAGKQLTKIVFTVSELEGKPCLDKFLKCVTLATCIICLTLFFHSSILLTPPHFPFGLLKHFVREA